MNLRHFHKAFRAAPDGGRRPDGDSSLMRDALVERIEWGRRGTGRSCIGTLRAGEGGIQLAGRDPSGVEVSLSIPLTEVEDVHTGSPGDRCVVLELAASEPILLSRIGAGPSRMHLLARRLAALTRAARLPVAQGG